MHATVSYTEAAEIRSSWLAYLDRVWLASGPRKHRRDQDWNAWHTWQWMGHLGPTFRVQCVST